MQAYDHASRATKGARDYQEDSSAFWPPKERATGSADVPPTANNTRLVAVLADGMGGHTAGALASRMVCDSFISTYAGLNGARPERLLKSLTSANDSIAAQVRANPTLSGMGTTLVAAVFGNEGVEWVSVGDSPLLLYPARRDRAAQRRPFAGARTRPARGAGQDHARAGQDRPAPAHAALGRDRR